MKPDISHWRDSKSYDFLDTLPIEGLAWECLRRCGPYQEYYQALAAVKAETAPLPQQAQSRWGLRFPGKTGSARHITDCTLVAFSRSCRFDPHPAS